MESDYTPIILFDGDCGFCSKSVQFIIRRDKKNVFKFASLQSNFGKLILDKFGLKSNIETIVLINGNDIFLKSTAALKIAKNLTWPIKGLYAFIIIPTFIRDSVYDIIARNRHYLIKNNQACELNKRKHPSRFM